MNHFGILSALIIILLLRKVALKRGEMFLFYLVWYSAVASFIEGMRTDSLYVIGELRAAQLVSVMTIVLGIAIFIVRRYVQKVDVTYQDK